QFLTLAVLPLVHSRVGRVLTGNLFGLLVALAYFGPLEGLWGWTLGKGLFRFRVGGADNRPPGVPRALLRITLLYAIFALLPMLLEVCYVLLGLPNGQPRNEAEALAVGVLAVLEGASMVAAPLLLFSTMRPFNGYRGLHEVASGTHTYRLRPP